MPPITCIILAKNEAHRLPLVIAAAKTWAGEVIVACKPSTDGTEALVETCGAKLHRLPDSAQGMERGEEVTATASNDWVLILTAGEIPTPGLTRVIPQLVTEHGNDYDAFILFFKYWSFGIHDTRSPWSWSGQIRLMNRKKVIFKNKVHDSFSTEQGRTGQLDGAMREELHILHQTHPTCADFMRSHLDYMRAEAAAGPAERLAGAKAQIAMMEKKEGVPEIHRYAWLTYWNGVALHCMEALRADNVLGQYAERRLAYAQALAR